MAISEKTIDQIKEAKANLQNAIDVLQLILDGNMGLAEASRSLSMGQNCNNPSAQMKHALDDGFVRYIKSTVATVDDLTKCIENLYTPGDRLLLAIFDGLERCVLQHSENTLLQLPEYDEELLWKITEDSITPREYKYICMYTGKDTGVPMTIRQIGKSVEESVSCVNTVLHKGLLRLRKPQWIEKLYPDTMLKYTTAFYAVQEELQHARELGRLAIENQKFLDRINGTVTAVDKQIETYCLGKNMTVEDFKAHRVIDLNIGVKTMNCLLRSGIESVDRLTEMTRNDFAHVRQFGAGFAQDLMNALKTMYGIEPEGLKEFIRDPSKSTRW